ncbi:hypothetical protein DL240_15550 [Lujinxingia litoralis]|uniref:Thioredoxin domain-containing protein n=1 Tax=Lujinxingia litoralis TaxID=2211119 RepID=A0A328C4Q2_9DELT|nr:thioredoxin family protein [Lujinxingia litoralis]RAL20731.1 hypothetical protein DL240_15550 [Lujinxingia litoralis]
MFPLILSPVAALAMMACEPSSQAPDTPAVLTAQSDEAVEACEEESDAPAPSPGAEARKGEDFVGELEPESVRGRAPGWAEAGGKAPVDEAAARALGQVAPGAQVKVVLGTWCSDSVREVTRFWEALELAPQVPFGVEYVGVDRKLGGGDVDLAGLDIIAVPTFIVYRDGEEVGRVIERPPGTIEGDLLALLTGERRGKLSATR